MRMQPIVVTLSTMFILQGVTLLVMDKPGGIGRMRGWKTAIRFSRNAWS